jgi:hypothetical protein
MATDDDHEFFFRSIRQLDNGAYVAPLLQFVDAANNSCSFSADGKTDLRASLIDVVGI